MSDNIDEVMERVRLAASNRMVSCEGIDMNEVLDVVQHAQMMQRLANTTQEQWNQRARAYEREFGHEDNCTTVLSPEHPFEGCNCVVGDIERGCVGDVAQALTVEKHQATGLRDQVSALASEVVQLRAVMEQIRDAMDFTGDDNQTLHHVITHLRFGRYAERVCALVARERNMAIANVEDVKATLFSMVLAADKYLTEHDAVQAARVPAAVLAGMVASPARAKLQSFVRSYLGEATAWRSEP